MRNYSDLIVLPSYSERLAYLQLFDNNVTSPRHMSADFYRSNAWKHLRQTIIDRDLGFDLGVFGVYIEGPMYVHHINPIDEHDIRHMTQKLLDPENLITVSGITHNLIHYRTVEKETLVERTPGDTKFW
jgi:hypothetical protein